MYILEAMFEYFISVLTTGAYLAKLTTTIGISDGMTAVLSSVTSLAAMFQLISIFVAHKTPVKRWVLPLTLFTQSLVSTLYIIPFLNLGAFAPVIFFLIILTSKAATSVMAPIKATWFLSLVNDEKRGDFQAKVNIVSLAGGMVFTLLASFTIDKFEANQNLCGAFITLTITICILTFLQFTTLLLAREKPEKKEKGESPFRAIRHLLENKIYKRILILNFVWAIAANITTPFLSTYQIKELGFSMTFISVVGVVLSVVQMIAVYFFGRYSMRHSHASIMRIYYVFATISFVFVALSTRSNGYVMFTTYRLINLLAASANCVSATNFIFITVSPHERTSAIALNAITTGLAGFCITLITSPFLDLIQKSEIMLFGIQIYAQQIFALISFVITVGILLYYQHFCHKLLREQ